MDRHIREFRVTALCRVFSVSRSGFYAWRTRRTCPGPRALRRATLDRQVAAAFAARKGRCGSPTLTRDLHDQGLPYDRKTVAASQQRQSLRAKAARKWKATTNSNHSLPVAPNLLKQDFAATAPNRKWVGDITYLWTDEGWLYLAVIIDLYSRLVVGWALSERMTADLAGNALTMALWRRKMPKGVIVHSDRGSQYCSREYQALIQKHELRASMSAKGNCWDNAVAESFFHTLKMETVHGERFPTRAHMRQTVFEYIEVDYNRFRRHSANGYISPEAFEAQRVA
jgi:transposase InsO family protein